MSLFRSSLAFVLLAVLAVPTTLSARVRHHAHRVLASNHHSRHHSLHRRSRHHGPRGQQAIAPERVTEIQQALIRVHYYSGQANGVWDETTKTAMQKYQADQGWQTKLMPDSRALKKLGLGPDYSNAINAKNLSLATPPSDADLPPNQSSGFAEASGSAQ